MNPYTMFCDLLFCFLYADQKFGIPNQHESINLSEEKKIIKDIKQLESTRDKVIANDVLRAEIQKSVGEKDSIQDQVKVRTVIPNISLCICISSSPWEILFIMLP